MTSVENSRLITSSLRVILLTLLHASFIVISYDPKMLAIISFQSSNIAIIIHRMLMLMQFIPLMAIMQSKQLHRCKLTLAITFAICINTLYIMNDIYYGFYGALLDYKSEIIPEQRTSAHMMAYEDTHHIAILDYRAEYMHALLLVFILSKVANIHYIFTYAIAIRSICIVLWTLLMILLYEKLCVLSQGSSILRRFFSPILATSMLLIANSGYWGIWTFGFPVFILILLTMTRHQNSASRSRCIVSLLALFVVLTSGIIVTLDVAYVFLLALLIELLLRRDFSNKFLALLIIAIARIFIFSSLLYIRDYKNYILELFSTIWRIVRGEIRELTIERGLFLTGINPVDKIIDSVASFSMMIFIMLMAVLCFISLLGKRRRCLDSLSVAILLSYVTLFLLSPTAYITSRLGLLSLYDIGVPWFIFPIAPLAILRMIPCIRPSLPRDSVEKIRKVSILCALTLILIITTFAPLYQWKGNVKSAYDGLGVIDANDYMFFTSRACRFITSHIALGNSLAIDPSVQPLLWHELPLKYTLDRAGHQLVITRKGSINLTSSDLVYSNDVYLLVLDEGLLVLITEIPNFFSRLKFGIPI